MSTTSSDIASSFRYGLLVWTCVHTLGDGLVGCVFQMYPSIQAKIWGNIGQIADLLDMVLDSFIKVNCVCVCVCVCVYA